MSCFHICQFQVFNSGAEGLVVVLFWFDLWKIFFLPTLGFELGISGSLVLHSTTAQQWFCFSRLSISGISLWCRGIGGGNVLIWPVRDFLFAHNKVWTGDLWIWSPALYQCTAVILFFTSENFRYLTLVQRDWWWYCSDWSCEGFSFCPHWGLNWGPLDL